MRLAAARNILSSHTQKVNNYFKIFSSFFTSPFFTKKSKIFKKVLAIFFHL